jgi:hypothetical protein
MPLHKGSSQAVISENVGEMVHEWKKHKKIGTSRPKTRKKAVKQAVAIAMKKAGKSNRKRMASNARSKKMLTLTQPRPIKDEM